MKECTLGTVLAEASVGEGLVDKCSFWWWKGCTSSYNDVMVKKGLVGDAAMANGAVGCRLVDGVVVFVVL